MAVEIGGAQSLQVVSALLNEAARLVREEPDIGHLTQLAAEGLFEAIPEGFENGFLNSGFPLLEKGLEPFVQGAPDVDRAEAALRREWLRLFGGVGEPLAPSWANYYLGVENRILGRETLALRRLYAQWGLVSQTSGSEPDDGLGLILGFLAYLAEKEATACEVDDEQTIRQARGSRADILRDHLLPWISAWHYAAAKNATSDFYAGVADFTLGAVIALARIDGFVYDSAKRRFLAAEPSHQ